MVKEVRQQEEDGIANMKKDHRTIAQIYRDMQNPVTEAVANAATLEYGTTIARDEYAKDTPGQTPGDAEHQPEHAKKASFGLAVDGVPKKGGEMIKPNNDVTTGLKVEGIESEPELVEKKMAKKDHDGDGKVETKSAEYLGSRDKAIKKAMAKEGKQLDPVGQADADIDNDGDVDSSDKYLHKRRKAIKKAMAKEAKDYCDCGCECGKKICESCNKPHKAENVEEGFKHYNVTHKPSGKKYRVTAMHANSAKQKAAIQHGGRSASAYSGTSDSQFHVHEASAAEVLKKRYASDAPEDNPQATKRIKDHIPGMKTFKAHPHIKFQPSTGTYSKKGKMAALKKQHARRPEQYGITKEFVVPEYSRFIEEGMSVTLRKSKSQPNSYKVHSVGNKMKKHGGIKPGERVKDHEIDYLHDSGIKVKYHKESSDKITRKDVRMGKGVAWDKRYKGGNYSGAVRTQEKIKKGLSKHPEVADSTRRANEQVEFAKGLFEGRVGGMSPAERKVAAGKIFQMHQAKKKNQQAKRDAMKASKSYKTSDDSHLDAKPKKDEPKRGRGEKDTPHIVSQLRGVVDVKGKNHAGVKFKDGSTHKVSHDHAKAWLKKHDSAKPGDKLKMYGHHDSHKAFKAGMKEDVQIDEISNKVKTSYIKKANLDISDKEKIGLLLKKPSSTMKKDTMKRREGVRLARSKLANEETVNEISKNLATRYIKRAVGSAISNADKTQYHVSKSMQKRQAHKYATNPSDKGQLTKGANKEFKKSRESSRKTMNRFYGIQRAAGKLNTKDKDKGEYLAHSMTKQKTSSKVKATEAIERRADKKRVLVTDPATGKKIFRNAPRREIEIGKGKEE